MKYFCTLIIITPTHLDELLAREHGDHGAGGGGPEADPGRGRGGHQPPVLGPAHPAHRGQGAREVHTDGGQLISSAIF